MEISSGIRQCLTTCKAAETANTWESLSSSYILSIALSEHSSLQTFFILRSACYHLQYKTLPSSCTSKNPPWVCTAERINLFGRKHQGLISELTARGTPEGKLIFKMVSKPATFLPESFMDYIQAKIYKRSVDLQSWKWLGSGAFIKYPSANLKWTAKSSQ